MSIEEKKKRKAARMMAWQYVKVGVISRPDWCQSCGAKYKTQIHHANYDAPLSIIFLCACCHSLADKSKEDHDKFRRIHLPEQSAAA